MTRLGLSLLRKIGHLIPIDRRRALAIYFYGRIISPAIIKRRRILPGPVAIVGFFSSSIGLGQGARLALKAFQDLGYETRYFDAGEAFPLHQQFPLPITGRETSPDEGGLMVIHLNPPELAFILPFLGRGRIRHKKLIGYWAYELERIPKSWHFAFNLVDEIWVPSHFVGNAIASETKTPVKVVHHPIIYPVNTFLSRSDFDLPQSEEGFVVLTMLDLCSSLERKNTIAAIRAFRQAFGISGKEILAVKVSNSDRYPEEMDRIHREIDGVPNIRLVFEKFHAEKQLGFIGCADVILALHRSEGFGLVLAEAQLLGKPVIATAYSGNMDFMDQESAALVGYRLVPVNDPSGIYSDSQAYWAEADVDEAANWLGRLRADRSLRERLGEGGRKKVQMVLGIEAFAREIAEIENLPPTTAGTGLNTASKLPLT